MKLILTLLASAVLTACGGGGSSDPVTSVATEKYVAPVVVVDATSKYVGTWAMCDRNHVNLTVTFTEPATGILKYHVVNKIYERANCTGAIVGLVDYTSPVTFTFNHVANYTIYNKFNAQTVFAWYNADVDVGSIGNDKMTVEITGTGVQTINAQRCVFWTATDKFCFDGTEGNPDYIADAGFMVSANRMAVALRQGVVGATYSVINEYSRQ